MKNLFSLFCICISVIFSCKKDEVADLVDYTYNFTEPVIPSGDLTFDCPNSQIEYSYIDQYTYSRPMFNPINPNEIAYLRHSPLELECKGELWIFNFKTGRTYKVTSQKMCKFDWSILNWIVFGNENGEVWKVKPNGSELTKILPSGNFYSIIKINNSGNQFFLSKPSQISFGRISNTFDLDGNLIQDIPTLEYSYIQTLDWNDRQIIFSEGGGQFNIYHFQSDSITIVENQPTSTFHNNNLQLLNNDEILWSFEKYIHQLNLKTLIRTTIKLADDLDWFGQVDASIDQKTIIVRKQDFIKHDECTIHKRTFLSLMDIDGSNERRILIPE